jgi:hypothetical protein
MQSAIKQSLRRLMKCLIKENKSDLRKNKRKKESNREAWLMPKSKLFQRRPKKKKLDLL